MHTGLEQYQGPRPLCRVVGSADLGYWHPSTTFRDISGLTSRHLLFICGWEKFDQTLLSEPSQTGTIDSFRKLPHTRLTATSSTMVEITIRKRPRGEAVVTQRKFFKKTARGKVIKGALEFPRNADHFLIVPIPVLRERYLRNDVGCGISGCRTCVQPGQTLLPPGGSTESKLFSDGHIVIPDTNVFLAQVNNFPAPRRYSLLNEGHTHLDGFDGVEALQPSDGSAPDSSGRGPPSLVAFVQPPQGFSQVGR